MGRQGGFTLLETMAVALLLAVLGAISLLGLHRGQSRADSQALAYELAADLRQARARALETGIPQGLAFPTAAGTTNWCQGTYQLQGEERGQLVGRRDFRSRAPGCAFFLGYWTGPAQLPGVPLGSSGGGLNFVAWNAPRNGDRLFVFLSDGSVVSNQPRLDGAFRVLTCQGCVAAGPTWSPLLQVSSAYCVTLTPQGSVSVEPGVPGASAVTVSAQPLPLGAAPPALPALPGANSPPQLVTPFLGISPQPNPVTLDVASTPGSTLTLGKDGVLTLTVSASDPDGDPLTCLWTATGPAGKEGYFGKNSQSRMVWQEQTGVWTSSWSWTPPHDCLAGEQYTLTCLVSDPRGGTTGLADVGVAVPVVSILSPGRIVFTNEVAPNTWHLATSNWDGTDVRKLNQPSNRYWGPRWSPDGRWVAAADWTGIKIFSADGAVEKTVAVLPFNEVNLAWSPEGRFLYAVSEDGPNFHLYRIYDLFENTNPNGTWVELGSLPFDCFVGLGSPVLDVHPNGEFLWVNHGDSGNTKVHEYRVDPNPANPAVPGVLSYQRRDVGAAIGPVHFNPLPGDPRVSFTSGMGADVQLLDFVPVTPANPAGPWMVQNLRAVANGSALSGPCWSPDGQWLLGTTSGGSGQQVLDVLEPVSGQRRRLSVTPFPGQSVPYGTNPDWSF